MTATAPSMAAVVLGMVSLSPTSSAGITGQYPRSGLRLLSGSKVRPRPRRLISKLRGEKSRNGHIVRSTAQVLQEESGAAAGAGGDSVVSEVALLNEEPETPGVSGPTSSKLEAGPLVKGGILSAAERWGSILAQRPSGRSPRFLKQVSLRIQDG